MVLEIHFWSPNYMLVARIFKKDKNDKEKALYIRF